MRFIYNNVRSLPFTRFPLIFSIILSLFAFSILQGAGYDEIFNPPDLSDGFDTSCRTPGEMADSDGSCEDYPAGMIDLLMLDEEFDDYETKYVYIKAEGEFACGYIYLNPKASDDCYYEGKIPGPQFINAESCNTGSLDLVEIGYWDNCSGFSACSNSSVPYTIGENTITFNGYEVDGNDSYWYYTVESGESPAISHLSFFLMCPDASLGDYVWFDENKDGLQGDNESGVNGVMVKLLDDHGQEVINMPTKVNPNNNSKDGFYMFTDLLPGDYSLTFYYPIGYCVCNRHAGDNDEIDSDIMEMGVPRMAYTGPEMISLSSGEHNMSIDGGLELTVLPVRFGDFTVKNIRNQIELNWTTLSEINNEGFYIEKATDEKLEFSDIGFVKGVGNSNELNEYSYVDLNLGRNNMFSYRIRQVDTDGHETHSAIRSLRLQYENEYEVFPNPTTGVLSIILPETINAKQISVYNTIGQLLYSLNIDPVSKYYQLDLSGFEEGIYLIRLEDGINSKIKKVILNY